MGELLAGQDIATPPELFTDDIEEERYQEQQDDVPLALKLPTSHTVEYWGGKLHHGIDQGGQVSRDGDQPCANEGLADAGEERVT